MEVSDGMKRYKVERETRQVKQNSVSVDMAD